MNNIVIFKCPHCKNIIEKNIHLDNFNYKDELCFRHGNYKNNLRHIDYNLSNLECFNLFINDKINGCGKKCIIKYYKNLNKFIIL